MPGRAEQAMAEIVDAHDRRESERATEFPRTAWSAAAKARLDAIEDPVLRDNMRLRAEKKARGEGAAEVSVLHVEGFLDNPSRLPDPPADSAKSAENIPLHWQADALARLARLPACRKVSCATPAGNASKARHGCKISIR